MNAPDFAKRTKWEKADNELTRRIKELRREETPFWDLTVSNPSECQFSALNDKKWAIHSGTENQNYKPQAHGLIEAREAICRYYAEKKIKVDPIDIFITANTSEAYSFIFKLLMNPGDKLLAPAPSYPLVDHLCTMHDVETLRYPLRAVDWKINFEQLKAFMQSSSAKALLSVHPNNPTGNYVTPAETQIITRLLNENGLAWIVDEVFYDFSRDLNPPPSFAGNQEVLTFTLSGISKVLALPQMKLSWFVLGGPQKLKYEARARLEIIADAYLSAGTPAQLSLAGWLDNKDEIQNEIQERIRLNREFLDKTAKNCPTIKALPTAGGWSVLLKMPDTQTDDEWALKLLMAAGVIAHPGYYYDIEDEHYLVLSLIVPTETFQRGVKRIAECATSFKPEPQKPSA